MANVVGVVLLVLVLVAIPLRYGADVPQVSAVVSPVHGALYIVLVLSVIALGRDRGWSLGRMVLVALGGTIPFVSFYVERRVSSTTAASR